MAAVISSSYFRLSVVPYIPSKMCPGQHKRNHSFPFTLGHKFNNCIINLLQV